MGDVSRMNILRTLAAVPEISVTELAYRLVVSQPLASWHLRILRRAGVITTRREGRQVYCALAPERLEQFREAIGDLIDHTEGTEGKEQLWEKSALPSSA
ncbi:MAG TPA: metalloregulator ArsR/SmtB family transcription factor [Chloroflexota bacterium]|nr:metalloregulator ArsR/SmtB family transcription factor [Chloroflexota bacterium]